jgi:ABC-type transporter Mla subunit MlaD
MPRLIDREIASIIQARRLLLHDCVRTAVRRWYRRRPSGAVGGKAMDNGSVADVGRKLENLDAKVEGVSGQIGGLTQQIGGLTVQVGGLTAQVGGLTKRVDDLTERFDGLAERVDGLTERVDGLTERLDDHRRSTDRQFAEVQFAFGEMRTFVSESIGSLRSDMVNRFDRVEDKLDRALAPRPSAARRPRRT